MRSATDRWTGGHWFTPFGPETSLAYYDKHWMPPGNFEGETDWSLFGGYMREAPHASVRVPTDSVAVRYAKEIKAMKAAGYDGCTVDLLSNSSSSNDLWERTLAFQDACAAAGDFDFLPMPDGSASFCASGANPIADHLATLFTRASGKSCLRIGGGRLVHAPFAPESAEVGATAERALWDAVDARLRNTHGLTTWQWNVYVTSTTSSSGTSNYNDAAYIFGHGRWGVANPEGAINVFNEPITTASNGGKPWMHYLRNSDHRYTRTTGLKYEESDHTRLLRENARAAITHGTRGLQLTTHNDYRETAAIAPSRFAGYAWLDLASFYLSWYKLKARQPILRDTLYLSWRVHRFDKTSGFGSAKFDEANIMPLVGGTAGVATVESLVFLTSPATVVQVVANTTTTPTTTRTDVTQAMIDAQWDGVVPVKVAHVAGANGGISSWIERGGVEVANTRVDVSATDGLTSSPLVQDLNYRLRSSRESLRPAT